MTRIELRTEQFKNPKPGRILLVGERPAPSSPDHPEHIYVPFAGDTGCSRWLNDLLDEHRILEENLSWLNAYYYKDQPTTYEQLIEQNPKVIITLGGVAERWLSNLSKVPGTYLPRRYHTYHPQYWKRFNSKSFYPLIEFLKHQGATHPRPF